ncbi:MAG: shikimate kinase [Planctomycetaceae bacterium]|jgi:shikimate kinase|nr:shikimate kinase [Planctomycetaceae bacterium]MBT4011414.1 shikimate kinase [Planctomycetaceae bacterium]MBT4725246.1 shikimate kinase [Planctomycetaceae bacterium]MBT4843957.1 shikimate kinase [Planctomycetaceae bacterium]MBT5123003.1 shikimate kinase [Planctomycetaceae bacterium]
MNIFLIGYRATGKSTVARNIAAALGLKCVDSDALIALAAGMTIAEIFVAETEEGFRDRESEVVAKLALGDNQVVALGGGAVLRSENREAIRNKGAVVWLQASVDSVCERLAQDSQTPSQRPQLTAHDLVDEVSELMERRRDTYAAVADFTVDTESLNAAEVALEIIATLSAS